MIPAVVFGAVAARRRARAKKKTPPSAAATTNNATTFLRSTTETGLLSCRGRTRRVPSSSSFSWIGLLLLLSASLAVTLHVTQLQQAWDAVLATTGTIEPENYDKYYSFPLLSQQQRRIAAEVSSPGGSTGARGGAIQIKLDEDDEADSNVQLTFPTANTTITTSSPSLWKNDYNIVHVVHTRFMQHQPTLQRLAAARWELFQTITLPSLQQQTTQQFLWILRIDPLLSDEFQTKFMQLMYQNMSNVIVLLSNDNPPDFRKHGRSLLHRHAEDRLLVWLSKQGAVQEPDDDMQQQYQQKRKLLQDYYTAAQSHVVLETRLDADDALAANVLEGLQRQAQHVWQTVYQGDGGKDETNAATNNKNKTNNSNSDGYRVWCLGDHVEWQYQSPVAPESSRGSLVAQPSSPQQARRRNHRFCITAGLTFGYQVNATADHVPTHKHHQLHKMIPPCQENHSQTYHRGPYNDKCLAMVHGHDHKPLALRARTPTSAGMMNVFLSMEQSDLDKAKNDPDMLAAWSHRQTQAWESVQHLFGTNVHQVIQLHNHLRSNLPAIAADNAAGQCTPGHSCKTSSREILERLQNSHTNAATTASNLDD